MYSAVLYPAISWLQEKVDETDTRENDDKVWRRPNWYIEERGKLVKVIMMGKSKTKG